MMYQWINGNSYMNQVTFYPTNITLNSTAASHFSNVRYVRIGIDPQKKKVAIMPVEKSVIERNCIPKEQLQKISIGKGYGRISNKAIMHQIYTTLHVDVDTRKYPATFDEENNLLEIDCMNEI